MMKDESRSPSFFRSSHFGIALWYTILIGCLSLAFGAFIYASQTRDVDGDGRFRVTNTMEAVQRALGRGDAVSLQDGDIYALFDGDGRVLQAVGLSAEKALSLAAAAARDGTDSPAAGRHGKPVAWTADPLDRSMLYGYMRLGGPKGQPAAAEGSILLGSPRDPYGLRRRLLVTLLIAAACMLGSAILSGAWLANRAMRPVARMARTARTIGEGDLSRRIRLGTRDELGELSTVFDAMLDRLEAAFDRQKRFVADAGHELRTPLSIISLESERALSSERTAEEYRQSLSVVRTECTYMAKLVADLLLLARADSDEAARAFTRVDMGDVAVEAMERLAPLAARRGITLNAGTLPEAIVRGDRAALATMVGNLVDNAIKYGRSPGGRVDVGIGVGAAEAVVRVTDDGPGIPAEKLGRVFDRFYRIDEARAETEDTPAGSGLGLSIVKAIAGSHGGRVDVRSAPGSGSEFTVSLPLATGSGPERTP